MVALVRIIDAETRARATHWCKIARSGVTVVFRESTRTNDQNAKLWAMLNDVSSQMELHGHKKTRDIWKAVFMKACEYEVQFTQDLNGDPFPMGFRSSKLSVAQMGDLITFIMQWGDEAGVNWSNEAKA